MSPLLSPLRILLLSNGLEMLCVALILPAYPTLTKSMGISLQTRGLMISLFSFLQFLMSPLLGRGSDVLGRGFMLRLSAGASIFCYVGMLLATDQRTFILARVLPGFVKCGMSVSQAYVSDVGSLHDRAQNLSMLGSMYGIAFVFGPALGGLLMGRDPWLTVQVALLAAALNLLVLLSLPEPTKAKEKEKDEDAPAAATTKNGKEAANGTTAKEDNKEQQGFWHLVRHSPQGGQVSVLLFRKVFVAMASGLFETSFAEYSARHLGLKGQTLGLLLSFLGAVSVLNNTLIVRWLSNRYEDKQLVFPAILGQAVSFFCWGYVHDMTTMLPVLAGLTVSGSISQTLLSAELSKVTPHALVGTVLGVSYAIETFAKILTPFLGGFLLEKYGGHALGFAATCFVLPVCANVALEDTRRRRREGETMEEEDKKTK